MRPTTEEIAEYGPAIEDVLADAAELQRVAANQVDLPRGSAARIASDDYLNELSDRICLRAARDGLNPLRLIWRACTRVANDRRGGPASAMRAA